MPGPFGATGVPFLDDIGRGYLNQNPPAAFNFLFGNQLAKNNPFARFLKGQQGDYYDAYQGAVASDPNLNYLDFLQRQNPMAQFQSLTPGQRGERSSPAVRWMTMFGGR